jgi:signal transduction histidine kinase/FixJ family two-component response regulator
MKLAGANPLGHFGYWAAATIIVVMGWTLYDATITTREASLRVDRTLEAIEDISRISEAVSRADAAQRGFFLTSDDFNLVGRDRAMASAMQNAESLTRRFSNDREQADRVAMLKEQLADRIVLNDELEASRRAGGLAALRARMASSVRQSPSAKIYDLADAMRQHELRALDVRRADQRDVYERAIQILGAGGFILVAVMIPGYIAFIREASGRHRAEQQVADIAGSLPGAVLQLRVFPDKRMRYEYLSGGAAALGGVRREDALRDPEVILSTVIDTDRQALLDRVYQSCTDLQPFEHDFRVKDPAGVRWLRVMAAPRREADGSTLLNAHWGDVTEQRRMARELRESKEAADAANRAKSTFLATMSHEIRTPMHGVLGMLELLLLTRLDGEQRTTLEIVRQSGGQLLRIIDDILDFSRIEAGKLELRPEPASVKEIVERVCDIYVGNASSKGLLLTRFVDGRISPALIVDATRLQQVLNNFVSNAIKFTSQGDVTLRAELVERHDGEDTVRFSVEDTGIGISPADQERLFQPFVETDGAGRGPSSGGTGLGLSICQRLAVLMGGTISLQSEVGRGTTISMLLPLPIAAVTARPGEAPPLVTPPSRRAAPTVQEARDEGTLLLLVDDHPINRMVLARQVRALGYAAEVAQNGLEALDRWSSDAYALVITDCNMPEMNGYELARHIRSCEARNGHGRTPIIACTANALGGEAQNCYAAGMDDYLAKPIQLAQLAAKLEQWLPLTATRPPLAAREPRIAPIDRTVLAEISAGDPGVERDILERFRVYNSEDAHLLLDAIEKADLREVTHASHRIKGASKTIGAMSLAAVCERLERASRANDWPTVSASMKDFSTELERVNAYVGSL